MIATVKFCPAHRRIGLTQAPLCFRPIRSLVSKTVYENLSGYNFKAVEKNFIVGEILIMELRIGDLWIDFFVNDKVCPTRKVALRYSINLTTVESWVKEREERENSSGYARTATRRRRYRNSEDNCCNG